MSATYNPAVFDVDSIQRAMEIILTPEGQSTEDRWRTETPYLADLMRGRVPLTPESLVLDYGCGIGRMSQELIRRFGCRVVGLDISPSMRALAPMYVQSERFMACSPEMLDTLGARGVTVDAALSVWVLQHCLDPKSDIARIQRVLKPRGACFVVNNLGRAVPTVEDGWANDGVDIQPLLADAFEIQEEGRLAPEVTGQLIAGATFWAHYRRRA
jgi:ubiquinone/menaquinone biosynthesis C-methylase UbiE